VFTQCPECQTIFRVSAAMLKAAQGQVRCGHCDAVFDALAYLMESSDSDSSVESGDDELTLENGDSPESTMEFDLTDDDLGKIFVVAPAPTLTRPVAEPAVASRTAEDAEYEIDDVEAEGGPVEIITLEGDHVETSSGVFVEQKAPPKVAKVESRREAAARIDAEVQREIEAAFAADPSTTAEFVLPSGRRISLNKEDDEIDVDEVLPPARKRFHIDNSRWLVGSAVLGVLLLGQIMHANRQSLVRSPVLGPVVGGLYAALGSELTPAWDVGAYELRQWGAAADPDTSGTLRVRASLLNAADHAQPYPLLRLTLQDRFGSNVGSRDLEPNEYLPGEPGGNRLLGAGQRIDAEIAIVDPGKDAVGFEIDVCLRGDSGTKCANEQARQTG
jgi:predicted Zn finger-like uncharacterized protein